MNAIRRLFARTFAWTKIGSAPSAAPAGQQGETLRANLAAVVINGFFFPTAGKLLGTGLLLTWFLSELTASAFVIGLLIPIQYDLALIAQPWIGQWLSARPALTPFYRNQALLRGCLWIGLVVWMWRDENRGPLLVFFSAIVLADAVAGTDPLVRLVSALRAGEVRGAKGLDEKIDADLSRIP